MAVAVMLPPPPNEFVLPDGSLTKYAQLWFQGFTDRTQAGSYNPGTTNGSVPLGTGAIGTTTLLPVSNAGLYRVTWYLRVLTPATVSSSVTVTITWTDGGVVASYAGAAVTGNTTTTLQSDTVMLLADAGSPITYSVAYSSSGATDMIYHLFLVVEAVS